VVLECMGTPETGRKQGQINQKRQRRGGMEKKRKMATLSAKWGRGKNVSTSEGQRPPWGNKTGPQVRRFQGKGRKLPGGKTP